MLHSFFELVQVFHSKNFDRLVIFVQLGFTKFINFILVRTSSTLDPEIRSIHSYNMTLGVKV